jgi:hypothetical protein
MGKVVDKLVSDEQHLVSLDSILCERQREKRLVDLNSKSKNPLLIEALSNHFEKVGIY